MKIRTCTARPTPARKRCLLGPPGPRRIRSESVNRQIIRMVAGLVLQLAQDPYGRIGIDAIWVDSRDEL